MRAQARRHESERKREARKALHLDTSKINDPNTKDPVGPHSEGEAVVRAEILLDRLKFSPGQIGAEYNDNVAKAIAAFQSASGLPAIGFVDATTWDALNADLASGHVEPKPPQPAQAPSPPPPQGQNGQAGSQGQSPQQPTPAQQPPSPPSEPPAIMPYTISAGDVKGPFTKLPRVTGPDAGERLILREARLPRLNYSSPLDLLAERFHATPSLLKACNPDARFDKPGKQILVPNVTTPAPPQAASVVVDASTHSVTALDGSGKILAFYPATIGSKHDPLPVGQSKIVEVRWHPKFKYNPNLFWDSEDKHPRATLAPGPRNPVGVVWMQLDKPHYGIHGTPEPATIGLTQSHGCIRLTNWDADELGRMVHAGTPVLLEEGTPAHGPAQPASSH